MYEFIAQNTQFIQPFLLSLRDWFALYLPLGLIGAWRWGVWSFKQGIALFYRPDTEEYSATVSIVTPVYNEDPDVFKRALNSWLENKPYEIIAVVDYSDKSSLAIFTEFAKNVPNARMIVTEKPGKRPALADGILAATGEIVALVDSDTLWTPNLLRNALPPFRDPLVGGVGTRQNVLFPRTASQKIFDIQLDSRYFDELPFLAASGDALTCLSGRTALYRRSVVTPLVPGLLNETFWGRPVISGDDKCLTYLVEKNGWKLRYQQNAQVFTPGVDNWKGFFKQRLRWSRNSWRADLKALWEGWVWRHPALAFHLLDRCIQPFTLIIGPIYLAISLLLGHWMVAAVLLAWWHLSRFVKIFPHLRRRPQDILVLPIYIATNFWSGGFTRLYSLFTLNTQGWITRWDSNRMARYGFIQKAPPYAYTTGFIAVIAVLIYQSNTGTLQLASATSQSSTLAFQSVTSDITAEGVLGVRDEQELYEPLFKRHEIVNGDSMYSLGNRYGVKSEQLIQANKHLLARADTLRLGMVINVPGPSVDVPQGIDLPANDDLPKRQALYDEATNTITLKGRGTVFTLREIRRFVGDDRLQQLPSGEWLLKANLDVRAGTVLKLDKTEVKWLKLASNANGSINIEVQSAVLVANGVKITSWDEGNSAVDEELADGRSYIIAKYPSRMDFFEAEIAYLGYDDVNNASSDPTYGLVWKNLRREQDQHLVTGDVRNSNIHHNFVGAYVSGGQSMNWEGNIIADSLSKGVVLQDGAHHVVFTNNRVVGNQSDGMIVQNASTANLIAQNSFINNHRVGLSLKNKSEQNQMKANIVYGNEHGIALIDSDKNLLIENEVYQNQTGIIIRGRSVSNVLSQNKIYQHGESGVSIIDRSDQNLLQSNNVYSNAVGITIKGNQNELVRNSIRSNAVAISFLEVAEQNRVVGNTISANSEFGILAQTKPESVNLIGENRFIENRTDFISR